jgi:hypothetical protein
LIEDQPRVQGGGQEQAMKRLSAAEARLRKFQAAIEAGVDPAAMVEAMNQAQAERVAARAEVDNAPEPTALTDAEVYAMIDPWVMWAPIYRARIRRGWQGCTASSGLTCDTTPRPQPSM